MRIRAKTIAGAFHVHSVRSDGSGSRAEIAAAAARAGLQFVIITDHGDATRSPIRPPTSNGVLCIDAVEISSNGGHVVAFDMPAAPYPLGGEAAAVVEDIVRLGGMPVIAHPDSPKSELAWKAWSAPAGGLEWLNLDSAWRDEPFGRLARIAVGSFFRPAPALAVTLDSSGGAPGNVGQDGQQPRGGRPRRPRRSRRAAGVRKSIVGTRVGACQALARMKSRFGRFPPA